MARTRSVVHGLVVAAVALALIPDAYANDVTVPVDLQVQLLGHVARYERGFAASSSAPVHVMVVSRRGNAESQRIASQLASALTRSSHLGGRRLAIYRLEYSSAASLRAEVDRTRAYIVYFTAGFGSEIAPIADALAGQRVITVSSVGADADRGAVLAFELVSSRPQIVVNLRRARNHQLQFSAQFLRLARVIR